MLALACTMLLGCKKDTPPVEKLQQLRDSTAVMSTLGVSKLISDSGVMRYRIVAEKWDVYDHTNPPRQYFPKGLFLQRFNNDFRMDLYIEADSAWCYNQNLWKLQGNVFINDLSTRRTFRTQELFWNMSEHRFYSNVYIKISEPERELEGDRFWANEQMTIYHLERSRGFMPMPENNETKAGPNGAAAANNDTLQQPMRTAPQPIPKRR